MRLIVGPNVFILLFAVLDFRMVPADAEPFRTPVCTQARIHQTLKIAFPLVASEMFVCLCRADALKLGRFVNMFVDAEFLQLLLVRLGQLRRTSRLCSR